MNVDLIWITPDAENLVGYMARVSNVNATKDDPAQKLIAYLLKHKHFSPFEMVCMCISVQTTREIARQMLRHRSLHFQEFSQRYAKVDEEPEISQPARLQDEKNRQNSIPCEDVLKNEHWVWWQNRVWDFCWAAYSACLKMGIAKELARKLLPEGLSKSYLYIQGSIRDWIHYLGVRSGEDTQFEHRAVALEIAAVLKRECPTIFAAAHQMGYVK